MNNDHQKILIAYAIATGIDRAQLLQGLGITLAHTQGDAVLADDIFAEVMLRGYRLSPQPGFCIHAGHQLNLSSHGVLGHAFLCCSSLSEALYLFQSYYPLLIPSVSLSVETSHHNKSLVITQPTQFQNGVLDRLFYELAFSAVITTAQFILNRSLTKAVLHLPFDEPLYSAQFTELYQISVRYNQTDARLIMDNYDLNQPLSTHNPAAAAIFHGQCQRLLDKISTQDSTANKVRARLVNSHTNFPSITQVAQSLNMSERSLRRHLDREDIRYRDLLEEVKGLLAEEYLLKTGLPLAEVARLLGFSDLANFRRAFKRWRQLTPHQFRLQNLP